MPDFDGELVDRRPDSRQHAQKERVSIALNDLGARRSRDQSELGACFFFNVRRNVCVGTDRTRNLADAHVLTRQFEAAAVTTKLVVPNGELEPKRGRLGMDAMGSTDHRGHAVRNSLPADDLDKIGKFPVEQITGARDDDPEPGVVDVVAGQSQVDEP